MAVVCVAGSNAGNQNAWLALAEWIAAGQVEKEGWAVTSALRTLHSLDQLRLMNRDGGGRGMELGRGWATEKRAKAPVQKKAKTAAPLFLLLQLLTYSKCSQSSSFLCKRHHSEGRG
jgi:hypothetical protein